MEITRQNPSARLVVPDKVTVRQQMAYFSAAYAVEGPVFERYWAGAAQLITEWECEIFPDKSVSIDSVTNPQVTAVLIWAGLQVKNHIDSLDEVPPN